MPRVAAVTNSVIAAILAHYPFDEDTTTVMDYACGTGLISQGLASHSKQIIGIDISQGMVDVFNTRVYNQGLAPEDMKAICAELKEYDPALNGQKFDVITVSLSLFGKP